MAQNKTLSHDIAQSLRTDILRQRYRCEDRLPSERELATRFGASRGAVREALSQLEQLGLIRIQPGGARVQPIEAASIAILGPLMELEEVPGPALVDQFLQTFGAMAALTAREAVAVAGAEELQALINQVSVLKKHSGDFSAVQAEWVALLEAMTRLSDNLVVRLIGNDLKAQFVSQMLKLGIRPVFRKRAIGEVLVALERALKAGDRDLAHAAITRYFDELRLAMQQAMESRKAG